MLFSYNRAKQLFFRFSSNTLKFSFLALVLSASTACLSTQSSSSVALTEPSQATGSPTVTASEAQALSKASAKVAATTTSSEGGFINLASCATGLAGQSLATTQVGGSILTASGTPTNSPKSKQNKEASAPSAGTMVDLPSSKASLPQKNGRTQTLLVDAYQLTGRPYKVAGRTPVEGFDDVGFANWIYYQNGTKLPQDYQKLIASGQAVTKENLRPGDLLIYRSPWSQAKSYHVGIYTGRGNFLHADAKLGLVTEAAAFEPQFAPHFLGARRFYDDPDAHALTDEQKMAATSAAVKVALAQLDPDDKLER